MTYFEHIYDTPIFTEIWEDASSFITDYKQSQIGEPISEDSARVLFYLLYSRYGNSPIVQTDVKQWKIKLFSKIYSFGPTWEKKMEIQEKLRSLSDDELMLGSKSIHNHANNPPGVPSTAYLGELPQIDDQSVSSYKRSKVDAYENLWGLLATDVTESFLDRFSPLFMPVIAFNPILFPSEVD